VFDLSLPKLLILAVIALVVFGPNELPKIASRAGQALRDLRRIAEGAQADLREGLGPEFADFDLSDLNPRRFVHKHLLSELGDGAAPEGDRAAPERDRTEREPDLGGAGDLGFGDLTAAAGSPFDAEAT
jgi:sec-independent protein translocase protein TatB